MSFSSLYIGATGVIAHNTSMAVLANNLANVNTIGYRAADTQFGTLMSQQVATSGTIFDSGAYSVDQLGLGVAVSDIRTLFTEGGIETSTEATDLAIQGQGFFGIRDLSEDGAAGATHYTRAGSFRFDSDAYLVNPNGYRLQGYAIDETGTIATTISDVQLPYEDITVDGETVRVVRSDPYATATVEMVTNLDATAEDVFASSTNPFFSMLESYNATLSNASSPFGDTLPSYSSSITVYDEDGNAHDLTVYFDPVDSDQLSNATAGYSYWEYVIAMPADSDGSSAYGTSAAGLAAMGVLTFNAEGEIVDQAAFSLDATAGGAGGTTLSNWSAATFNSNGLPQFSYTFGSNGTAVGTAQTITYDFGINSETSSWTGTVVSNAAAVSNNVAALPQLDTVNRDARTTTSYDLPSSTTYAIQDGYTWGYLESVSVDQDGILSGYFSNGQTQAIYQVAVYNFTSPWELSRDGHTNFVATEASGAAIVGTANQNGMGTIAGSSLEQSNVDMAEEFAHMILTQRGYQANTKVITTADSILNTTISVKR